MSVGVLDNRDRLTSFTASIIFHVGLLLVGGILLVKPLEYGVEIGASATEINLVAAPPPGPMVEQVIEESPAPIVQNNSDPIPIPQAAPAKNPVSIQSMGGAIVEAKPEYLSNPAPRYPAKARQNGWEGLVVLHVQVSPNGHPRKLEIEQGSGYDILDQSAVNAVSEWVFRPAEVAGIAIGSSVRVPVRFKLEQRRR